MKFLFDLFPIILFFVAFKVSNIFIATGVAIAATLVQVAWVAFRHRKVDTLQWVSLGLIVVFGGATLVLHDQKFIQWKLTVLYWLFAVGLLGARYAFRNNLIEKMMGKQLTLPDPVWDKLNLAWALFFAALGAVNLYVMQNFTESQWVNFKMFGTTGAMIVFIILQSLWLAKYLKDE
ncbi:septation protein A [Burkholderia guangdongensis]|uniref:septation protein A n=1 Tax=Burkholderia guangdongensis TaxID=1792500 RepID=UPI0015CE14EA|nr:septation protein A [Burkholderia guangdongensis]